MAKMPYRCRVLLRMSISSADEATLPAVPHLAALLTRYKDTEEKVQHKHGYHRLYNSGLAK